MQNPLTKQHLVALYTYTLYSINMNDATSTVNPCI